MLGRISMLFFKRNLEEVWVNIDKPTKKCTIHSKCTYLDKKRETKYKGILELKRDGGWLKFDSNNQAKEFIKNHYDTYQLIEHC
jgi:hypothetical protein